ncbi:MAG: hypothetical protein ACK4PI_10710 [Tepidisphaerales bacterium]
MAALTSSSTPIAPGCRVKVIQQIPARNYTWVTETVGTVLEYRQKPTGSWYAHSKDDKLWLDRLVLRLDDGEITTLNLDEYAVVEVLSTPSAGAESASSTTPNAGRP